MGFLIVHQCSSDSISIKNNSIHSTYLILSLVMKGRYDSNASHQGTCVGGVRRIILQEAREAEVRHLADEVAVD